MSRKRSRKKQDDEKLRDYFDSTAFKLDGIYENNGGLVTSIINKLFRKDMIERIPICIQESSPLQNKSVLDIGCGPGRASLLFSKLGANTVGIDFATRMIEIAKKNQGLNKVDNVEFIHCEFMNDFVEDEKYDVCIVLGVLDYIKDPLPFLTKIKRITKTKIIATYPAKFSFQSLVRKVWLRNRTGPVYLYTEQKLKELYSGLGVSTLKIIPEPHGSLFHSGYIVIATIN